jgi:hypothetical protein
MPRNDSSRRAVAGRAESTGVTTAMTMFLAAGCGMVAAGSDFVQPLAACIGRDVGVDPGDLEGLTGEMVAPGALPVSLEIARPILRYQIANAVTTFPSA